MQYPRLNINDSVDRLRIALCCRDADLIPRVPNAGGYGEVNGVPVQIMHNGMVVMRDAYYGPYVSTMIHHLKGVHDPQEEKCFAEILPYMPAGAVMLELGAFWAYYSLWFNKSVPGAQCHMVEMNSQNLEIGIKNFALNGARGFFTHAGLLNGLVSGEGFMTHGNMILLKEDGEIPYEMQAYGGSYRQIPMIGIDQYMKDNALDHIHMLHCDAQGAEYAMLAGAEQSMRARKISYMFVSTHVTDECHAQNNINLHHEKCIQRIKDYGYHIVVEHNLDDTYSGDGLIVAKAPSADGPDHIEISRRMESIF